MATWKISITIHLYFGTSSLGTPGREDTAKLTCKTFLRHIFENLTIRFSAIIDEKIVGKLDFVWYSTLGIQQIRMNYLPLENPEKGCKP